MYVGNAVVVGSGVGVVSATTGERVGIRAWVATGVNIGKGIAVGTSWVGPAQETPKRTGRITTNKLIE